MGELDNSIDLVRQAEQVSQFQEMNPFLNETSQNNKNSEVNPFQTLNLRSNFATVNGSIEDQNLSQFGHLLRPTRNKSRMILRADQVNESPLRSPAASQFHNPAHYNAPQMSEMSSIHHGRHRHIGSISPDMVLKGKHSIENS
jgi:hypothetical protein